MRLSQEPQGRGLVEAVFELAGEVEGPGQLGESRRRLAGREPLAEQQAREHLAPAVGGRARHLGGPAADVERRSGLAEPKARRERWRSRS